MFQYTALAKEKQWQPGPYAGVELLVLHKNAVTGGVTVLRKFRAGTTVHAHIHSPANEFAYVQCLRFHFSARAKEKQWQPGPYAGVELLVLHKNEVTGGVTVLRKFRAGTTVPAHIHPQANEFAYVLSGEWEESGVVYTTGAFFFAPKGEQHGPHVARTEVLSLTLFDGPLTVV